MIKLRAFLTDESGATAIEYALIAGSLSIVIVASVTSIGTKIKSYFTRVSSGLS